MFQTRTSTSLTGAAYRFSEVVYRATVRAIRNTDGNAILGLLKSLVQSVLMVLIFYIMLSLLGGRAMAVRGDSFIYLLSGVFIFMTHITTSDQPIPALGMVLLGWYSSIGVGYEFLALRPWMPGLIDIIKTIYIGLNMFASGKMVVANTLPFSILPMFKWNPLFHSIDQARGFIFINYVPHVTNWEYAFWLSTVLIVIGFIGEGFVRQMLSVGWSSKT